MKTEYSHTKPFTSGRVRGTVIEQPKQEDLSSILDIIFDGWIDANQNVGPGITREALAREHFRRFEGLAGEKWKEQILNTKAEIISLLAGAPSWARQWA